MAAAVHRGFATAGYKGAMRAYATAIEAMQRAKQGFFPEGLATAYAALGDKDRAFYWLDQANQQREAAGEQERNRIHRCPFEPRQ